MKDTIYCIEGAVRFKIALLTDSHNGNPTPMIASLKKNKPGIVCIAGDILIGSRPQGQSLMINRQKNALELLRSCAVIAPTFVSLGNHEWMVSDDDIVMMEKAGAVVLDNKYITHTINGKNIVIGGLSSALVSEYRQYRRRVGGRYPTWPNRPRSVDSHTESDWLRDFEAEKGYKILLCHHPEYWALREPMLRDKAVDLVLAGHAHGGQIRFFHRGLYSPGQGIMPKYTSGIYKGRRGNMIISRGLSNPVSIPRLFNEPELVYVKIDQKT